MGPTKSFAFSSGPRGCHVMMGQHSSGVFHGDLDGILSLKTLNRLNTCL